MKLLAAIVTALSLFASSTAFAQAAGPSVSDESQAASPQGSHTIRITRSGCSPPPRAHPNTSLVPHGLILFSAQIPFAHLRWQRHFRARGSHGVAPSSAGSNFDRDGWQGLGSAMGWSSRGNSAGRRRVDSVRRETLAWSHGKREFDSYRDSGKSQWEDGRMDEKGER